ncbi:MAG: hypothetical protein ACYS0H_05955, partial [Planctomycetota bacterium]
QMRWHNTTWSLIQHIDFVAAGKGIISGRGPKFTREKTSAFQKARRPACSITASHAEAVGGQCK